MLHFVYGFALHSHNFILKIKIEKLNTNHAQDIFDRSDEPNERTPVRIFE